MKKRYLLLLLPVLLFVLSSCGAKKDVNHVTIACSPVPHAEIMNEIKDLMQEKGFTLEVKEFSDYVTPNLAVDQGEVDANYFQHKPYLDEFNEERGTKVVSVAAVHYEPFGIYPGMMDSLKVREGSKVAVPNDVTNEARSLNLLEAVGLIKLKDGAGLKATKLDIIDNPMNLDIVELESAQIPRALGSVDLACMNGNYAMEAGYRVSDALAIEDQSSEAAKTYANIICVKEGNENAEFVKALVECLKNQKVKDFIDKKYEKSVIYMD